MITSVLATSYRAQEVKARQVALEARIALKDASLAAATVYSPDGQRVLAVATDGSATMWDVTTGREVLSLVKSTYTSAGWSPDARLIAMGNKDGMTSVWDSHTGQKILELEGHKDSIRKVVFSQEGRLLATASDDTTARVWDMNTGTEVILLRHPNPVVGIDFSPDGTLITTADTSGTIRNWDRRGKLISIFGGG